MIAVVDYKKGNLLSVERGLRNAGACVCITADPAEIAKANAIVLPGVGAFASAATTMKQLGQDVVISKRISQGVPFLGICLGLHLLFDCGEEGSDELNVVSESQAGALQSGAPVLKLAKGLGVFSGCVRKMPKMGFDGKTHKVPHVGWNVVHQTSKVGSKLRLFDGIKQDEFFYFTHSFVVPDCESTVATATHSITFPCAVQKGNCFAVQFHPEKSSSAGAKLLRNFVDVAKQYAS